MVLDEDGGISSEANVWITVNKEVVVDPCDLDGDQVWGALDLSVVAQRMQDGIISSADPIAWVEAESPYGLHTYWGDSNLDGQFDEQDLVATFISGGNWRGLGLQGIDRIWLQYFCLSFSSAACGVTKTLPRLGAESERFPLLVMSSY